MVKTEAITGIALNGSGSQNCLACRKGKQMWNIILQVTQEWSTKVLGWVFSDICGPIETTSIKGYWYFITFMDDFSRYTHVRLCKAKDDAVTPRDGCVTCHTCHASVTDFRPIWGNTVEVAHMTSTVMYINSHTKGTSLPLARITTMIPV